MVAQSQTDSEVDRQLKIWSIPVAFIVVGALSFITFNLIAPDLSTPAGIARWIAQVLLIGSIVVVITDVLVSFGVFPKIPVKVWHLLRIAGELYVVIGSAITLVFM